MAKFIVEQEFLYGWENVWHCGVTGEPTIFNSYEGAKHELEDFIKEAYLDYKNGYLDDPYDINEFRIIELQELTA